MGWDEKEEDSRGRKEKEGKGKERKGKRAMSVVILQQCPPPVSALRSSG